MPAGCVLRAPPFEEPAGCVPARLRSFASVFKNSWLFLGWACCHVDRAAVKPLVFRLSFDPRVSHFKVPISVSSSDSLPPRSQSRPLFWYEYFLPYCTKPAVVLAVLGFSSVSSESLEEWTMSASNRFIVGFIYS